MGKRLYLNSDNGHIQTKKKGVWHLLTKEEGDYGQEHDDDEEGDHGEHSGSHDELNRNGPFNQMKMTQLNGRQILFAGYHKNTGDIGFAAWEPEENHNTK